MPEEREFFVGSEKLLRKIADNQIEGLASAIALMEIKWALYEKGEATKADKAVSLVEEMVEVVPVDKETAKEAIDLKIARKLELLDSLHLATARIQHAVLVTRDTDLRKKCEGIASAKTPEEALEEDARRE